MKIAVIGGGILGLAVAKRLAETRAGATVTVLEKENRLAAHQTGHNSGVVHAGLYYPAGSLKARLCRRGVELLKDYCAERGLPYAECGKLVVARSESELPGLAAIEERATANGVPGLRRVDGAGLREIEPHAVGVAALHSPHTAITDFVAVAGSYARDLEAAGGTVRLGFEVTRIDRLESGRIRVRTGGKDSAVGAVSAKRSDGADGADGDEALDVDRLIVCAGLHTDRVGRLAGDARGPMIVPFRGEYHRLRSDRTDLVRGLIYPVPDPRYPFLGVHFTRRVDGTVDIGPNAVLATSREGYRRRDVRPRDVAEALTWPGTLRMAARHWRTGLREVRGSLSTRAFLAEARTYVPEVGVADVGPAPAGVRAQALDRDGSLVDDFRISGLGPVTVVRNAPSPAATSSLAIADHILDNL